ncbi:MAG: hypothetical protein ACYC4J_10295 [Gemmatimonadaceae bacterium]
MSPAQYQLLYDVTQSRFSDWPLAVGAVAAGVFGLAVLRVFRDAGAAASGARMSGLVLVISGFTAAAVFGLGAWLHHAQLRAAVDEGRFRVVSGSVYDQPLGAADPDSWVVEGAPVSAWYRYEGPLEGAGYRREAPGSGGLRDGSRVRIIDVNGRIARLEVAR